MAISIAQCYTDTLQHMPDMDQTTFLTILNSVYEDLVFVCAMFNDVQVQVPLVNGQAEYPITDTLVRNWAACYVPNADPYQWYGLKQTSIDFGDYQAPGWRTANPSQPQNIYFRGSVVGFIPPPNATTTGGYPYVLIYGRESQGPLNIGSSLPPLLRTDLPFVYRTCERYAAMRYPARVQEFEIMAKSEEDKLIGKDYGRNARDHPAIRVKRRWIRAM